MTKLRKSIASFLFVVALVFSAFAIISFNANTMASADTTNNYYTAEQYTDSDYLLLDNGTESLTKTIKNFSNEVKSASFGTAFPELSQVIPRQPRGRAVCLPTRGHFRPRLRRDRAVVFDKRGVNPL